MKIEGTYTIKAPRELMFALLVAPEVLQRCVPGCQSLETQEDGSYKMTMKTGIGSIKGQFTGLIRLEDIFEPEHYKKMKQPSVIPAMSASEGLWPASASVWWHLPPR